MAAVSAEPTKEPHIWAWENVQAAFGLNGADPQEQMLGSVVFGVAAWISTAVSLGATAILVVLAMALFAIGFVRLLLEQV